MGKPIQVNYGKSQLFNKDKWVNDFSWENVLVNAKIIRVNGNPSSWVNHQLKIY